MSRDPEQVVVTAAVDSILAIHAFDVHHRDYPEVRGEGYTPEDAAARLAALMALMLDCASSEWRRESIWRAIEDVRAFADRDPARSPQSHEDDCPTAKIREPLDVSVEARYPEVVDRS